MNTMLTVILGVVAILMLVRYMRNQAPGNGGTGGGTGEPGGDTGGGDTPPNPEPEPTPEPEPVPSPPIGAIPVANQQEFKDKVKAGKYVKLAKGVEFDVHIWMKKGVVIDAEGAIITRVLATHMKEFEIHGGIWNLDTRKAVFNQCPDLLVEGATVSGHVGEDGFPSGGGISTTQSDRLTIRDCSFENLRDAIGLYKGTDILVTHIKCRKLAGDAFKGGMLIDGEFSYFDIADGRRKDNYHADGLQIFSAGLPVASKNLHFYRNKIRLGDGTWIQGIFANNEELRHNDNAERYDAWVYEENDIEGCHTHGISIWGGDRIRWINNTLRRKKPSPQWVQNKVILDKWESNPGLTTPSFYAGSVLRPEFIGENKIIMEDGTVKVRRPRRSRS